MQVVLKTRIPKLGNPYDIVNVKPGYARNFLLPRKLAVLATPGELKRAEGMKAKVAAKLEAVLENAKEVTDKLKGAVLTFKKKARGEKLYGSIKETDIVDALKEGQKVEVSKDMIKLEEPLKDLGEHTVKLQLNEEVSAELKVVIEAE